MECAVWQRSELPGTGSDQTEAGEPSVKDKKDLGITRELCNNTIQDLL